jgi:thiol-disulfide isomerase/thioredoxin
MLVMGDLKNHSLQLYESNSEKLNQYFENTTLGISLQERYEEERKLLDNPDLPKETELLTFKNDDPSKYLEEIISNANGKVIYIDNWATWCGPCKAEFKEASPALHEKFKEDVEFVYLCHASDKKAYLPSISQFQIKGKHYFLDEKEGAVVQDQINLEGFPTYTIIDQQGNQVLSDYIHRPSYKKTTEILNDLIQNDEMTSNNENN